jgi:hypothetical protein
MKILTFLTVIIMNIFACSGQNLIGYNSNVIRSYMTANRKDLNMDKVNNTSFKYLKYSDKYDTQTVLFFLSSDSVCFNIRMICNNNIRSAKMKELDSAFLKKDEKSWIDRRTNKNYLITLVDEEWSFTVTIEPEK